MAICMSGQVAQFGWMPDQLLAQLEHPDLPDLQAHKELRALLALPARQVLLV